MIIRQNYIDSAREGLALEMTLELERWDKWFVQAGQEQSHFEHSSGGDGLGHIGPACAEFEEWILGTGFEWLQTYTGKKLVWLHRPSATRWQPGDYLREHTDTGPDARNWTFTVFLGREWVHDWGGHLFVLSEEGKWECIPTEFDRMALFYSRPHYVSPIASYAKRNRYALTAWFQNKGEELLAPVPEGKTRKP